MTNSNVKHSMIAIARKIANKQYENRTEKVRNHGTSSYEECIIPASVVRSDEINWYINNYPEFDEDKFRDMIKTFEKSKNKEEFDDQRN